MFKQQVVAFTFWIEGPTRHWGSEPLPEVQLYLCAYSMSVSQQALTSSPEDKLRFTIEENAQGQEPEGQKQWGTRLSFKICRGQQQLVECWVCSIEEPSGTHSLQSGSTWPPSLQAQASMWAHMWQGAGLWMLPWLSLRLKRLAS